MDDLSYKLLKLFSGRNSLTLSQISAILNQSSFDFAEAISYLRKNGLLRIEHNYSKLHASDCNAISPQTPLSITHEGRRALELGVTSRNHYKFNEIRAWVTLAIAVAALIISVIDLILK